MNETTNISFRPDPSLDRQLNLLETLFEHMPMGIAVLDREFRIQRYNPMWDKYSASYAPPSGVPLASGVGYFDHLPDTETIVQPLFERTLVGETVRQNDVRLASGGIVTYWDIVLAPLVENDEIMGILIVSIDATERANLRQNLEERVIARTQELKMLLDVAATANSSLDLDEMLTKTLDLLVDLVGASRAGVLLRNEETGKLEPRLIRPQRAITATAMAEMIQACQAVMTTGESLYIAPDAQLGFLEPGVFLPLRIREQTLGLVSIIGAEGEQFSQGQLILFHSIADQLAVAVENARLYEHAEEAAAAAERNRLARELHDAVTQTLFSASLIADVLPRIWERDIDQGRARLEELRELTRGALAEMRTLLLELRPATLLESSLAELLTQLIQAFGGRSRLPITLTIADERPLLPDIQVALYRIAQEALNNVVKHAGATQITVKLTFPPQAVQLSIHDNGRGFHVSDVRPYSLGLGIMRERSQKIGAKLTLDSQIGSGTSVTVLCPITNGNEGGS